MEQNNFVLTLSILLAFVVLKSSFSATIFQSKTSGLQCSMCPPGTYMKEECSEQSETLCEACGEGEYTAHNNSLPKCLACTFCFNVTEIEVKPCNSTTNTVCRCREGYNISALNECN